MARTIGHAEGVIGAGKPPLGRELGAEWQAGAGRSYREDSAVCRSAGCFSIFALALQSGNFLIALAGAGNQILAKRR
jgi:hypothetical protein